jgi:hypothetical protein
MKLEGGLEPPYLLWGPETGSYEHGNEISSSIEGEEFRNQLCDCRLHKKNFVPRICLVRQFGFCIRFTGLVCSSLFSGSARFESRPEH